MKYSLRSLMIVVLVAPAVIGIVAWFFVWRRSPAGASSALPQQDPACWTWSMEKTSLDYSIKKHLPDYDVEHVVEDEFWKDLYTRINIRNKKDGNVIYSLKQGYDSTVFTRWNDVLYVAEYSPIASGCDVVALDLKTGKQLWKSELQGIGPVRHSQYHNLVNIETDGQKVIVLGNEAFGRYIEHLDLQTGKTLANRQIDADPKSLSGQ